MNKLPTKIKAEYSDLTFKWKINDIISYLEARDNPVKKLEVKSEDEKKIIDLGGDSTCTICHKRFCTCPERMMGGGWEVKSNEDIPERFALPKNWGKINIDGELVEPELEKIKMEYTRSEVERIKNYMFEKGQENGKKQGRKEVIEKVQEIIERRDGMVNMINDLNTLK